MENRKSVKTRTKNRTISRGHERYHTRCVRVRADDCIHVRTGRLAGSLVSLDGMRKNNHPTGMLNSNRVSGDSECSANAIAQATQQAQDLMLCRSYDQISIVANPRGNAGRID